MLFLNFKLGLPALLIPALLSLSAGLFSPRPALAANEQNHIEPPSFNQQAHEQGRKIYNFRCYYCHGYSGDARTLSSRFLNPPPRDFTSLQARTLSRESMIRSVRDGHPDTAMAGFMNILSPQGIEQVVDFVRHEFILQQKENTRYHTFANGWPNHERYRIAYPFATGEIALDENPDLLSAEQIDGRQLFLDTCISCHDRSYVHEEGPAWEASAVSFPRNNTSADYLKIDATSEASVYARHDIAPILTSLSSMEKKGKQLFEVNCAFCHAADGTGKNWIGSFLEPRPRDLSDEKVMSAMTPERLRHAIEEGLVETTMPAWKNVLTKKEIEALIAYIHIAFHPLPGYEKK